MFFIEQKGLQIQDIIHCPDQFCAILGIEAPYYIILCKQNTNMVNNAYNNCYCTFYNLFLCVIENAS